MNMNLRLKFLTYIVALIIIIMGISTAISYFSLKQAISRMVEQEMQQVASSTLDTIATWVNNIKLNLNYWSGQSIYKMSLEDSYIGRSARKNLSRELNKIKTDYKHYYYLGLVNARGEDISTSEDGSYPNINITKERFFQEALKGKVSAFSPLDNNLFGKKVFVISVPVIVDEVISGVFYAAIDLDYLNEVFIKPVKAGKTGYAYLMDASGVSLAHPDKKTVGVLNYNSFDFGRKIFQRESGFIVYAYQGVKKIVFFKMDNNTGWRLAVGAPLSELLDPAKRLSLVNMGIAIFFILIAVFSISALYGKIILKPLEYLITGINQFSSGNLDKRIDIKSRDEFGMLAETFNRMIDNLIKVTASRDELDKEIVERKRALDSLRESETKFRAITELSPDSIMRFDQGHRHLYVNPVTAKETGISAQDFIGKTHEELGFPKELCALWREAIDKVFQTGQVNRIEFQLPNGVWIDWYLFPETGEDGKVKFVTTNSRDITFRKNSEEQLRSAYDQLQLVQGQLVQSAKMASVGLLAGGVAHEINNPLTGVLNNVQLIKMIMEQGGGEIPSSQLNELLIVIEEAALRCKKITQSLLDFSHASKGSFIKVSMNDIVDKVTALIQHELSLQNLTINKELQAGLPMVLGDQQLLQQIVFDMVSNARWAIKKKGDKEPGTITLKTSYSPQDKKICITIQDTGIGIPKENLSRIFEPFFTTKTVGEGTGLGLSIVYNIVKAHKGAIEVESDDLKGATFRIFIPECS